MEKEILTKSDRIEGVSFGEVDFPGEYGILKVPFSVWALSQINCKDRHVFVNLRHCWEGSEDCSICKGCGYISHD